MNLKWSVLPAPTLILVMVTAIVPLLGCDIPIKDFRDFGACIVQPPTKSLMPENEFSCTTWIVDGDLSTSDHGPLKISHDARSIIRPGPAQVRLVYRQFAAIIDLGFFVITPYGVIGIALTPKDWAIPQDKTTLIPAADHGLTTDLIRTWNYRATEPARSHDETGSCTGFGICSVSYQVATTQPIHTRPEHVVIDGKVVEVPGKTRYTTVYEQRSRREASSTCPGHRIETVTTQQSERYLTLDFVDPRNRERRLARFVGRPETVTRELSRRAKSKCWIIE